MDKLETCMVSPHLQLWQRWKASPSYYLAPKSPNFWTELQSMESHPACKPLKFLQACRKNWLQKVYTKAL